MKSMLTKSRMMSAIRNWSRTSFSHSFPGIINPSSGAECSGASGAKGGDQGECGPAKHVPDAEPDRRVTGAGTHTASYSCRHTPEVGAVCGKAARTDQGGGRAMKRASLPLHRREFIRLLRRTAGCGA